jgi:glycogen debranching enzyme
MAETVRIDESFYIVAEAERSTAPLRVLKHGDSFAVFDQYGDVVGSEASEQGLYYQGTRFLSRLELLMFGKRPLLLSSTVSEDNVVFTADLTNLDILRQDRIALARGEIHLSRSRVLQENGWFERIRIANYALHQIGGPVTVLFDADFADVFEVRGVRRPRRGDSHVEVRDVESVLEYRGLDRMQRRTRVHCSPQPHALEAGRATFRFLLEPRATLELELHIYCELDEKRREPRSFEQVLASVRRTRTEHACSITTSNASMNRWLRRSTADLQMMLTETPHGIYPYAGIPWFSTPFGRDGIITALELLWANPAIARGVLGFLAETQATTRDDENDAQPGKILHEMRGGEMAALREVPFGRYYGSVDATPLFVMLAAAYYERTADRVLIDQLWPHLLAALEWLRTDGDPDGDGFIEYARRSASGLIQQGWKDSADSVFHEDGTLAEPPIALCEVQGYAYAAWAGAARLARVRGDSRQADAWEAAATQLKLAFDSAFWCEQLGTYALALDGHKRPCRVRTSNPGHCLYTGIVRENRASLLAATLMSEAGFSGWGIRTVAAGEARYNPMSYHNGSIWPHDNALGAAGLARYGLTAAATRVSDAMFDLSQAVDLHRLPELVCGFSRRGGEFPTRYPVACAPQAWAAGAVYLLLEATLAIRLDTASKRVHFLRATLPEAVEWLQITNLAVDEATVDLLIERHLHGIGVTVLRRHGDLEIAVMK